MTRLMWCTIRVRDPDASLRFYRDLLGLQVEQELSPREDTRIVFLKGDGPTRIELLHIAGEPAADASGVSIGIAVQDPEQTFRDADEQGIAVSDPMPLGPGTECRFLQDPDGVTVQIVYEI